MPLATLKVDIATNMMRRDDRKHYSSARLSASEIPLETASVRGNTPGADLPHLRIGLAIAPSDPDDWNDGTRVPRLNLATCAALCPGRQLGLVAADRLRGP